MKEIYFFCDHIFDISSYLGITNVIRELQIDSRFTLIIDDSPNIKNYNFEFAFPYFDCVLKVGHCNYGGLSRFLEANSFSKQLKRIDFKPDSILFIQTGRYLVSNILLKRLAEAKVKTVWITQHAHRYVDDVTFDYMASFVYNFYHYFFGMSYVDVYKMRGSEKDNIRSIQHRKNPYDHIFYLAMLEDDNCCLASDEMYFPYYFPSRLSNFSQETVLLCGNMFTGRDWINENKFLDVYNKLIKLIKIKHNGSRFVYLPHPREKEDNRKNLDLRGFDIETSLNSELMYIKDPSISTTYSIWSTSSQTAELFGIRSYWFYRLFSDDIVKREYKMHFDARLKKANPVKFIDNIDRWMNGENDYSPEYYLQKIKLSVIKLLNDIKLL